MEDLSMFQRPRIIALEDENPGTYGTVLIYPLNRLVERGFVGDTAVNPWVGIFCRRQGFARESESLMRIRESQINLPVTPRAERLSKWRRCRGVKHTLIWKLERMLRRARQVRRRIEFEKCEPRDF
ncbi:hypothetical protein PIB30_070341 [Stylosanthes scabra]|uniref:TNase-like domain-containing protein n=1 Tax=Stylosanthes scabra TaxID=79078 RepID=A0ABU6WN18_9FABA|nr:hypothetical protein [Stylosanthes scabra]